MDRVIGAVATGMGSFVTFLVSSGIALLLFGVLWLAFGASLIWSQGSLDAAWSWLTGLPLLVQGIVWLLLLPVTAGLWIWEMGWPLVLRLVLVAGLAAWSVLIFLPRAAGTPGS